MDTSLSDNYWYSITGVCGTISTECTCSPDNIIIYKSFKIVYKNYEFSTRVGAVVDQHKALKQAGIVHNQ